VVKRIANLDNIPRDDEFKIKSRAAAVVDKWAKIFHPNGVPADEKDDEAPAAAPAGKEENGKMDVDEPASAKDIEAAAESTAAAAEQSVKVDAPAESAAAAEEPSKTGAESAMDTAGDAVAPSGDAAPADAAATATA
jgi:hypothetical protein